MTAISTVPAGSVRQHWSPKTKTWEICGADKRPCPYGGAGQYHRVVTAGYAAAAHREETVAKKSFMQALFAGVLGGRVTARRRVTDVEQSMAGLATQSEQPAGAPSRVDIVAAADAPDVVSSTAHRVTERRQRGQLDVVQRQTDGRFMVMAEDFTGPKGGQTLNVYPFGDLVTDGAAAQRLHDADPHMLYQNGECGGLAGELWNRNPHVREYYVFATAGEQVFGTHQFVQLTDGSYADSLGIWSEAALYAHWRGIDPGVELKVFDDGEPIPPKDPLVQVSNPALFEVIDGMINARFAR